MMYRVKRINSKVQIEQCEKFAIQQYMWESKQEPKVYGWLGYLENQGIYAKMVCEETNPKSIYHMHKDPVYKDSAMEIFLAFLGEGETLTNDCMYTNFEINSKGAMLANFGKGRKGRQFISDEQYEQTEVKATVEEDKWYIEVLFPESYLNEICDFEKVKKGSTFYCNFYKISESEEILHFGSYSPINSATPNFHLPVCFAEARIEQTAKIPGELPGISYLCIKVSMYLSIYSTVSFLLAFSAANPVRWFCTETSMFAAQQPL